MLLEDSLCAEVTEAQFCSHFPFMQALHIAVRLDTFAVLFWSLSETQKHRTDRRSTQRSQQEISEYELGLLLQRYYNSEADGINYMARPPLFVKLFVLWDN